MEQLYSGEYIKDLKSLHGDKTRPRGFGGKTKPLGEFHNFMKQWQPKTLLDYGCGKGYILSQIQQQYRQTVCEGYDPAVEMFNNLPNKVYDCVFSNDVLEHIEPNYIENVLSHISRLSNKFVWLRIDTKPARKKLSDGRNAHLILETPQWWQEKISNNIGGKIIFSKLNNKGKFDIAIEK